MNRKLKDTLLKVADYSDTQKQKAERAGNNVFDNPVKNSKANYTRISGSCSGVFP